MKTILYISTHADTLQDPRFWDPESSIYIQGNVDLLSPYWDQSYNRETHS